MAKNSGNVFPMYNEYFMLQSMKQDIISAYVDEMLSRFLRDDISDDIRTVHNTYTPA